MNNVDKQYLDLLNDILENGVYKNTRSGGVISVFDRNIKINMKDGFPMLTTKKIFIRGSIHEMLWMLSGDTNIRYLLQNNVHIWDDDAYRWYQERVIKNNEVAKLISIGEKNVLSKSDFLEKVLNAEHLSLFNSDGKQEIYTFGDLGPVYGRQWRGFGAKNIDQIKKIIELLKTNPDDRRLLCMAWNPNDLDDMALPPCHYGFQLYSRPLSNTERLDWLCEHSNGEYDEWNLKQLIEYIKKINGLYFAMLNSSTLSNFLTPRSIILCKTGYSISIETLHAIEPPVCLIKNAIIMQRD